MQACSRHWFVDVLMRADRTGPCFCVGEKEAPRPPFLLQATSTNKDPSIHPSIHPSSPYQFVRERAHGRIMPSAQQWHQRREKATNIMHGCGLRLQAANSDRNLSAASSPPQSPAPNHSADRDPHFSSSAALLPRHPWPPRHRRRVPAPATSQTPLG